jgi:diguanylate cyclase (GGDEF)-like protein
LSIRFSNLLWDEIKLERTHLKAERKKYTKWSFKIIMILMSILLLKVFEVIALQRIIQWIWSIPTDSTEELIDITITVLIFLPFLFIVTNQRIALEKAEEKYKKLAYYDSTTGLPNRRYFDRELRDSLIQKSNYTNSGAVLFIDIDGFKQVNDNFGHDVGDLLLMEIGIRLKDCVRKEDTISRFAGDEFMVFLPDTDKTSVIKNAKRIINEINKPFVFEDNRILTSTSIGIALFPEHGKEARTLIKNADIAMYNAKLNGKNNYEIFDCDD